MGRIKTAMIKRVSLEIFEKHKDKFTDKFEDNKRILTEVANVRSKKLRNTIAGYITRLKEKKVEI